MLTSPMYVCWPLCCLGKLLGLKDFWILPTHSAANHSVLLGRDDEGRIPAEFSRQHISKFQSWLWFCSIWPIFAESGATQSAGWIHSMPHSIGSKRIRNGELILLLSWHFFPCYAHASLVPFINLLKWDTNILHSGGRVTWQLLHH